MKVICELVKVYQDEGKLNDFSISSGGGGNRKHDLITKNRQWSENFDWRNLSQIMLCRLINIYPEIDAINNKLDYADMLNWSRDIPYGSRTIFVSMLHRLSNLESPTLLEIGTFVGTSMINMLLHLPKARGTVIDMWEPYVKTDYK